MQSEESKNTLLDIASEIAEVTTYSLLSKRLVDPSCYKNPPHTLEGKRELLISLTPVLEAAEAQRKTDTDICELFTRCRIEKTRTKTSWYRYIDIDTGVSIEPSEYEQRYESLEKINDDDVNNKIYAH